MNICLAENAPNKPITVTNICQINPAILEAAARFVLTEQAALPAGSLPQPDTVSADL